MVKINDKDFESLNEKLDNVIDYLNDVITPELNKRKSNVIEGKDGSMKGEVSQHDEDDDWEEYKNEECDPDDENCIEEDDEDIICDDDDEECNEDDDIELDDYDEDDDWEDDDDELDEYYSPKRKSIRERMESARRNRYMREHFGLRRENPSIRSIRKTNVNESRRVKNDNRLALLEKFERRERIAALVERRNRRLELLREKREKINESAKIEERRARLKRILEKRSKINAKKKVVENVDKFQKLDDTLNKVISLINESKNSKIEDSRYFLNMMDENSLNIYRNLECDKKEMVNERFVTLQPKTPTEVAEILEYVADENNYSEISRLRYLKNMPEEIKESYNKLPKNMRNNLLLVAESSNLITKNDIQNYWFEQFETLHL